ncbi:PAAR domain-containing protein [Streptomyces sp. NPDC014734]|uniref:PAAR domain-containing protein n=1 Tax=Streptomyces sp. NPDC014734 TaxID=3364886 RepID=UPI00370126B1
MSLVSMPAARVGDPTGHPGTIGPPGVLTVLIGGRPAATVGTSHECAFPPPAVHPPSVIVPPGSTSVLIGGLPAARVGDKAACGAPVVFGCPTVLIGG